MNNPISACCHTALASKPDKRQLDSSLFLHVLHLLLTTPSSIAQSAERVAVNHKVAGSRPAGGENLFCFCVTFPFLSYAFLLSPCLCPLAPSVSRHDKHTSFISPDTFKRRQTQLFLLGGPSKLSRYFAFLLATLLAIMIVSSWLLLQQWSFRNGDWSRQERFPIQHRSTKEACFGIVLLVRDDQPIACAVLVVLIEFWWGSKVILFAHLNLYMRTRLCEDVGEAKDAAGQLSIEMMVGYSLSCVALRRTRTSQHPQSATTLGIQCTRRTESRDYLPWILYSQRYRSLWVSAWKVPECTGSYQWLVSLPVISEDIPPWYFVRAVVL